MDDEAAVATGEDEPAAQTSVTSPDAPGDVAADRPAPVAAAAPDAVTAAAPAPSPAATPAPSPDAAAPAPLPDAGEAPGAAPTTEAGPPRRTRRPRPTAVADPGANPARDADPATTGRPVALRVAALHLRMGQLPLARAQLEALAGRGDLDERGAAGPGGGTLADRGPGRRGRGRRDAARRTGATTSLALLIAAESVAALGRPGEARRLARRALAVAGGPLDPVFAGMPRSTIWPEDRVPAG